MFEIELALGLRTELKTICTHGGRSGPYRLPPSRCWPLPHGTDVRADSIVHVQLQPSFRPPLRFVMRPRMGGTSIRAVKIEPDRER